MTPQACFFASPLTSPLASPLASPLTSRSAFAFPLAALFASPFTASAVTALTFDPGGAAEIDVDDASFVPASFVASANLASPDGPHHPDAGPDPAPESDLWLAGYWLGVRAGLLGLGVFLGRAAALAWL